MGDVAVDTLTKKHAGEFIQAVVINATSKINGKPLAMTSKRKIVKNISGFFYGLTHLGLVTSNPFANMTRSIRPSLEDKVKKSKRPWTNDEILHLIQHSAHQKPQLHY